MPGSTTLRSRFFRVMILLGTLFPATSFAQLWTVVDASLIPTSGQRDIIPTRYTTYRIDDKAIRNILWSSRPEATQSLKTSNTLLTVGLPSGTDIFRIVEYNMMEDELKAKYPDIKTFRGISVTDPYRTIRIDWTVNGFRAVIRDRNGMTYIDPYQRNDVSYRIVYFKKDFSSEQLWECGVQSDPIKDEDPVDSRLVGDCDFRSYRLAVATTGEYSNFFGATNSSQSALVLSQVVTAVNRVNDVYEADLTVRLILIGNTANVFYYNPGSDPYSGSACTQLSQNQTTIDNVIGSANYDIGHVFSVGSGGCAGLGVICSAGNKARGATGLNPPTGDPFYIDYVAHEMGHQFGGDHTFNGTAGSCNGNRVGASAYEPGSGSTIMAYAGICGAQDLQPNSDDYFHARSLLQIANKVTSTGCAAFITFPNDPPVANSTSDYTIPISTPFVLTGSATDPDADSLSYCWEQYDLEGTSSEPPAANDTDGPMFRSFKATPSPSRYCPRLQDLTQNINPVWEVLPSVSRTMNFKLTVRDYHDIAGCTDEDDVVITTSSTSGPFVVTSQNSSTTWLEGESQTITWNVANTTGAPVSCANVDIFFSTDGGMTYPTQLVMATPNDGSSPITVPAGVTTQGRVMVKGAGNIFFDINNANITVNPGLPNFTLSLNPPTVTECNDGTVQTTVNVGSFMGFINPVSLSLLSIPPGAIATFVPQVVLPGNSSTLTITNLGALSGTFSPTVRGTSTTGNQDVTFTINLVTLPVTSPTLTSPANNATNVLITPLLDWNAMAGITQYEYQVAADENFELVVLTGIVNADQFQVTSGLNVMTQYFWRVRPINLCGNGPWAAAFSFTTNSCFALLSPNVPVEIPASGTPTVTSTFTTPIELLINDVNIISLIGVHTYIDDLQFFLKAPSNTEVLFWNRPCNNHANFNINFDDEAGNQPHPCPPTNGQTYRPDSPLTPFDGLQSAGTWTLTIKDLFDLDGGSLNSWGLKVCGTMNCQLIVTQLTGTGAGSLPAAVTCAEAGDTIFISGALANQTINVGSNPVILNKNLVIKALGANTNITGTGLRVFDVSASVQAQLISMTITAGTSTLGGAIANSGILKLTDITVEKNIAFPNATLIENKVGSQMLVVGSCFINQ